MTLAEAVATIKHYCENSECADCVFNLPGGNEKYPLCAMQMNAPELWSEKMVETNIYDEEEIHENVTVQILRNTVTGETSIGWWDN